MPPEYAFGPSAERHISDGQISFFNEPEQEAAPDASEPEATDVLPPRRKKQKGHKKDSIRNIPKEVIEYTLSDDERVCPKCGDALEDIKTVNRTEIHVTRPKQKAR